MRNYPILIIQYKSRETIAILKVKFKDMKERKSTDGWQTLVTMVLGFHFGYKRSGFFQFQLENLVSFEVETSKFSFRTFSSGNSESEKKYSALETETEINVLTEHFFSFVDSALKMETKTFSSGNSESEKKLFRTNRIESN
ncbi:hypothetical protein C1645_840540 [Glomus cerebriforme]|uniref:Uncharacterized protein n=1 Tax=Glomus cerebriforme TaxID=658196 RepID=A0A397S455_9GLOM|nr:hypothetical protein C1645_840540 [Glomus cerebriforme]